MALTLSQTQVSQLYVAIFGRASEGDGNTYWQSQGSDMSSVADLMLASPGGTWYFGDKLNNNQEFIEHVYKNTLGKTAEQDPEGIQYWVARLDAGESKGVVVESMIQALVNGDYSGDALAMQAQQRFANRVAVSNYTAGKIASAEATNADMAKFAAFINGVDHTAASKAAAMADVDAAAGSSPQPEPMEPIFLTADTDRISGDDTAGNTFYDAPIVQNKFAGGVSNSLASADRITDQSGADVLRAELVPEFFGVSGDHQIDVQPRITGVETIEIEARDALQPNNNGVTDNTVTYDAKYTWGVDKIGSRNSDGDLVIENLTTLKNDGNFENARNTDELTITMDHTDNFNSDNDASDLTVYFDEDYLLSGRTTEGYAFYWLLDEDAELEGNSNRLADINVDGLRFSLDGGNTILDLDSSAAQTAGTHAGFVAALQARLAEMIADGTLPEGTTLTLDPNNTDYTYLDNGARSKSIPAIVLQTGDGTPVKPMGFSQVQDAIGEYDVYGRFNAKSSVQKNPVAINIDLHKAGREGEGGDLIVGGKELDQHTPGTREGEGIRVFHVDVLGDDSKPSNIGTLATTNNWLRTVNIKTAAEYLDGDSFASLTIRDGFGQGSLSLVNANSFKGDLTLGSDTAIQNLRTLTAAGGGDVDFTADITGFMKTQYSYTTGSGSDRFNIELDGDAVDTFDPTLTFDQVERTGLDINSGAGNDRVKLTMKAEDASLTAGRGNEVSQATMWELDNLKIVTGEGRDSVNLDAYGNFHILAGNGSDFVRINSVDENGDAKTGSWVFGQATGQQAFDVDADGDSNYEGRVLYKATLTVTFAGFESEAVEIHTDDHFIANQMDINEAIERAIRENPELNRLLKPVYPTPTTGTAAQQLVVRSTVGGLNDLRVQIFQPELVENNPAAGQVVLNAGDVPAIAQGIIKTTSTMPFDVPNDDLSSADLETVAEVVTALNSGNHFNGNTNFHGNIDANGVAGGPGNDYRAYDDGGSTDDTSGVGQLDATVNFSRINMGSGENDLVVLHSDDDSANVLEITQKFGKVSVVNFHDVSPNDVNNYNQVGNHALDFTTYLNNQVDPSVSDGNQFSAQDIIVTLNTNAVLPGSPAHSATALANSVNMLNFDWTVANTISFQALNETNLLLALNGEAGAPVVGGIVDATLDAAANTSMLIGNVQKHIVMVENNANPGEYKVFYLTSVVDAATGTTGGQFDTCELLGTMDFGNSINFRLVGDADWSTDYSQDGWLGGTSDPVNPDPDPQPDDFNDIYLPAGSTDPVAATDGKDNVIFDVVTAKAETSNTQIDLSGFNPAEDKLTLHLPSALAGIDSLDDFAADSGVVVQGNPFEGSTLVTFGPDADGDVVSLNLVGVADASQVQVVVVA